MYLQGLANVCCAGRYIVFVVHLLRSINQLLSAVVAIQAILSTERPIIQLLVDEL